MNPIHLAPFCDMQQPHWRQLSLPFFRFLRFLLKCNVWNFCNLVYRAWRGRVLTKRFELLRMNGLKLYLQITGSDRN